MFNWLTKLISKKEDWRLVKTITLDVKTTLSEKGKFYYHLHESDARNRKVIYACTIPEIGDLETTGKSFSEYQERIYRWEMGRPDPDIPTYHQVPEEDMVFALKGTIS